MQLVYLRLILNTSTVIENLEIVGYTLISVDHSSNTRAMWCLHLLQTLSCFQVIRYLLLRGMHKV